MTPPGFAFVAYGCPSLTFLDVSRCPGFDDKAAGALQTLARLETFVAEFVPNLTHDGIETMIIGDEPAGGSVVSRLRTLRLRGASGVDSGTVLLLAAEQRNLASLRVLDLCQTFSSSPHDADLLRRVAKACPKLHTLGLAGHRLVPAPTLKAIGVKLRRSLTSLDVGRCVDIAAADDLLPLAGVPLLQTLSFAGCFFLKDGMAKHIPPSSIDVDVSEVQLTDLGLRRIVANCSRLVRLRLDGCRLISDDGVAALAKIPTLRYLSTHNTSVSVESLLAFAGSRRGARMH